MSRKAKIKFIPFKTCFIRLPLKWKYEFYESQPLFGFEILFGEEKKVYVTWTGECTQDSADVVELSRDFGLRIGLSDETEVLLQKLPSVPPSCSEVVLYPTSEDDYTILEMNSELIEQNLMNQIRLIWKDQVFPIWTQDNVKLFVKVGETNPAIQPVLLMNSTKVDILKSHCDANLSEDYSYHTVPSKDNQLQIPSTYDGSHEEFDEFDFFDEKRPTAEGPNVLSSAFSFIFNYFNPSSHRQFVMSETAKVSDLMEITDKEKEILPFKVNLRLRVVPLSDSEEKCFSCPAPLQVNTGYISEQALQSYGTPLPCRFLAKLTKIKSPTERQEKINKLAAERVTSGGVSKTEKEHRKSKREKNKDALSGLEGHIPPSEITVESVLVQLVIVKASQDSSTWTNDLLHKPTNISLCDAVRRQLGLSDFSFVHLESVHYEPSTASTLILHPLSFLSSPFTEEKITKAFGSWVEKLSDYSSYVMLSSDTMVPLYVEKRHLDFLLDFSSITEDNSSSTTETIVNKHPSPRKYKRKKKLSSENSDMLQFGYFTPNSIKNISIKLGNQILVDEYVIYNKLDNLKLKVPGVKLGTLGGIAAVGDECLNFLELWLGLHPLSKNLTNGNLVGGNILLCGCKGIGKSTFARALCKELSDPPHYVYVHIMNCKSFRGKRVENISRKWEAACAEAVYRQPSVILLDDLDLIASAPATPEQEASSDGLYFTRIVQALLCFLEDLRSCRAKVSVIATAKSWQSLHPSLTNARGKHMFQSVIEIPPPHVNHRKEILAAIVESKSYLSPDTLKYSSLEKIAAKTEGYVAKDLDMLVDKATHAAWSRSDDDCIEDGVILADEDFEQAMESFTPAALHGLNLQQGGEKTWSDVGGLQEVRKVLHETLLWPLKYPSLFDEYPLRPETGILLYGAPGTGKTLIAGVIAKEWDLNFISIKGPELLSKYIGASEQAVREVFQRAQSAKPCILFFDEFDAIAPRRGHDSTGVTDRVVNQFLTQMDGVESIQGVYVLAATSRPDLIDPALLRPGRLDRCLYCPLPDEEERFEILNALSRHLSLSTDVDLKAIASITVNFSGADLQALFYSAQLEALHELKNRCLTLEKKEELALDEKLQQEQMEDIIYLPSIAEGAVPLQAEKGQRLLQEVTVIKENLLGEDNIQQVKYSHRRYSSFSFSITQKHLLNVTSEMKPSVSDKERERYKSIYESFIRSRGGDFSSLKVLSSKRVTLA